MSVSYFEAEIKPTFMMFCVLFFEINKKDCPSRKQPNLRFRPKSDLFFKENYFFLFSLFSLSL